MPNMPPQLPDMVMIAKNNQAHNVARKSERIMGICALVSANHGETTQVDISPTTAADMYLWEYTTISKEAFFDNAKVTILRQPKHGELVTQYPKDVQDLDTFVQNLYSYFPDEGYEGKDFFVMQAEKNGIKVKLHYYISATVEVNPWYYCDKVPRKISLQNSFP